MATSPALLTPRSQRVVLQLASFLFVGLAATACSSNATDATANTPDPITAEAEDTAVASSTPESLPFVDDDTSTTVAETVPEETTAPAESTTTTSTTTTSTTTTEPPPIEPVFSEDADVTHVRVNTDGSSLNVRSVPGVDGVVVGELASVTWYVETTGNVADLGGSLWREVNLPSGGSGWVSADFVGQTTPTCTDITVINPIESTTWDANLDGDGLVDVVNYVRLQDETMHVRVEFGNGATTATQVGVSTDVPFFEQGWVVAEDINGDGFDEIQLGTQFSGDRSTQFISMSGCDFITEGVSFGTWASAAGTGFWNCTDFGTSNVMYWDAFRTVDGITTADGFSFTPATGFTATGQQVTLTDEQAQDFFELLCSNDYD